MTRSNVRLIFAATALSATLMTAACGPGFVPDSTGIQGFSSDTTATSVSLRPANKPTTGPGWVMEPGFLPAAQQGLRRADLDVDLYYETDFKIPFGWVYSAASIATKLTSPMVCQFRGLEAEPNPQKAYARNELPCGKIVDSGLKRITNIEIPAFDQREGSYRVQVSGVQFPLFIGRTHFSGAYRESRLDSKAVETITTQKEFAHDLSVRFEPNGDSMKLHLCAAIPGFEVSAPDFKIRAKAEARLFGINPSYGTDLHISPGKARFDYARGCVTTDVAFEGGSFVPKFNVTISEKPRVSNPVHQGLNLRIGDWFLRMLDRMLGWFRASLRVQALKMARNEINDILEKEVETGEWLTRVNGEGTAARLSDQANRMTMRALRSSGLPLSTTELRNILVRQCHLLKVFERRNDVFVQTCVRALDSVKVAVQPFYRDPEMAARGCFDHFANIHESRDASGKWKWWARGCGIGMKFQVRITAKIADSELRAIEDALASLTRADRWLDDVRGRINTKDLDESLLLFVVDQAWKNGERIDSIDDLPALINRHAPGAEDAIRAWVTANLK